jgi:hypothetical protein
MKINIFEINLISVTRKTNSIYFNYSFCDLFIVRTDCVKDLGVVVDSKLHFLRHVYYLRPQALKLLGLIHFIKYNSSFLIILKVSYCHMY